MIDFDRILERVTIRDLLESAHVETRGNRASCPIHGGSNPTAFSFTDSTFYCFSCGAKGGLIDFGVQLWGHSRQGILKRLCAMAGIDSGGAVASRLTPSYRQVPVAPRQTNTELVLAQMKLEALKDLQYATLLVLRVLKKALKRRRVSLRDFYDQEQLYLYELEELDKEATIATFQYNQLRKGKKV